MKPKLLARFASRSFKYIVDVLEDEYGFRASSTYVRRFNPYIDVATAEEAIAYIETRLYLYQPGHLKTPMRRLRVTA